jgi:rare lipoprotein A
VHQTGHTWKLTLTLLALLPVFVVTSCSFGGGSGSNSRYSQSRDSAPSRKMEASTIKDAVPQKVVRTKAGNKSPYTVLGKTYYVLPDSKGFTQTGDASWYGKKFHGHKTSNGEIYDMYKMTAAHKTLPIPTYVKVTNLENNLSTVVRVNDRGPFHSGRVIDLSYAAATKLDVVKHGTARVRVEALEAGETYEIAQVSKEPEPIEPEPDVQAVKIRVGNVKFSTPDDQNYHLPSNTFLQVAAFSQKAGAEKSRNTISKLTGFPVVIRQSGTLFKVRIGPITDNFDLLALRQMILAHGLGKPHIVYD